jgi:hypothetical protein
MSEMTPQRFRNEYAKPLPPDELNGLLWEAIDTWEADLARMKWSDAQYAHQVDVQQARIEALEKAICEELCECGWFESPERAAHDEDCPYALFMAALAAHRPDVLSGEEKPHEAAN